MSELDNQEVTLQLPLHVVVDMMKIIEVTSTRGAYQASELQPVGAIYNILHQMVSPYQEVEHDDNSEEVEKEKLNNE